MSKAFKSEWIQPILFIGVCLLIYCILVQRRFFLYPQSISDRSTSVFFFYDVVYKTEKQEIELLEQCRRTKDIDCFHIFKMLQKNRSEVFDWRDVKEFLVKYLKSKNAISFSLVRKKIEPLSFHQSGKVMEAVIVSEHVIP